MRIDIITCLPGLLEGPFAHSIVRRAIAKGVCEVHVHDLRAYGLGTHKKIDDAPYGGEAGMVLMAEPIAKCINHLQQAITYDHLIYTAPDGELLTQSLVHELSLARNLVILCGHYKGIDERIRTHYITKEISIGDYVLSGGELAAAVITDAIVRTLPAALSDGTAFLTDSFQDGLIAPPVYTRPQTFQGLTVPAVLLSGNKRAIDQWKEEQALARTAARRPGLLAQQAGPHARVTNGE